MHLKIATFVVSLLAITNPVGNAAIFLGMTADKPPATQRAIAIQCGIATACILVIMTWGGEWILSLFGISLSAFQIAGGIIVFLIGSSMLRGGAHLQNHSDRADVDAPEHQSRETIGVVPLAMPIVAGPGAISMLISHHTTFSSVSAKLLESVLCLGIGIIVGIVMVIAPWLKKILKEFGINIITRVMGLILCAIAFQMIISGIKALL